MKDNVSFKVTCPYCGRKIHLEKRVDFKECMADWDQMVADFDTREFSCSCGETFIGAETVQSEKIGKILEIVKNLRAEGKFDVTEKGVTINLGLSDIWKLIRELRNLEGDLK